MSTTYQSYHNLRNPEDNIDKTHELYTLYYLFKIFKELYPSYFNKDDCHGRPRIYTADIILPFVQ